MPLIKEDSVKILQIAVAQSELGEDQINKYNNVYGLGDDGLVYIWDFYVPRWLLVDKDINGGMR